MLRIAAALCLSVPAGIASAQTSFVDSPAAALAAAGGPLRQTTFEDVAPGTAAPLVSLGVEIASVFAGPTATPVVTDSFLGGNHASIFGTAGSPTRFLVGNYGFSARFAAPVRVAGFTLRSTDCGAGGPSLIGWRIFDASDLLLDSGEFTFDEGCPTNTFVRYFGLSSPAAFSRAEFFRESGANFSVDDLQFGPIEGLGDQVGAPFRSSYAADFDDVPSGTGAPIASGELWITGSPQVMDNFFAFAHGMVFNGLASPPNMLWTNFAFTVEAIRPVTGIRFMLRGASCTEEGFFSVEGFDAAQQPVDALVFAADGCLSDPNPRGVIGIRPSHALHVRGLRRLSVLLNAAIDDLELQHDGIFEDSFEGSN